MWRRHRIVAASTLIVVLLAAAVLFRLGMASVPANAHGRAAAPAVSSATCSPSSRSPWSVVPTPSVVSGVLRATSAHSSSDAWSVGNVLQSGGAPTLTEHWNGSQWSTVPIVGAGSLYGLAAISASDVWTVGTATSGSALAEHYHPTIAMGAPGPAPRSTSTSRHPGSAILCP